MSYSIRLEPSPDTDAGCEGEHEVGNYTYNVGPMYRLAFKRLTGQERSLLDFNGAPGVEAAGLLREIYDEMTANPDIYEPLNPENGWGDYHGARAFIYGFAGACRLHPGWRIHIT